MTDTKANDAMLRGAMLTRDGAVTSSISAARALRLQQRPDLDEVRGKFGVAKRQGEGGPALSKGLDQRLGAARRFGFRGPRDGAGAALDPRQRAVVKIHFFGHGAGGGAALRAHGRYIGREAQLREPHVRETARDDLGPGAEVGVRAHGDYLSRHEPRASFYDALNDGVDGQARMAVWARQDRRHFRIILAPENGTELGDLRPYVRAVMERAEAQLGRLEWLAIDHHDTDNPHTHIVLRGRHANGRALILPREFVKRGLREIARDEATLRLGPRTRAQEQAALLREARAHRPTRLDALIERHLNGAELRVSSLKAPGGDPAVTQALKARARELQRLGLASEKRRNVLVLHEGWRERLSALELHLDIRKRLVRERNLSRDLSRRMPNSRGRDI